MNKYMFDIISAVRDLGVILTGQPAPKSVKISGKLEDFSLKLQILQEALEAFDAAGSYSSINEGVSSIGEPSPLNDTEKLKKAIDGLLKFIQLKGDFMVEADAIVRDALNLDEKNEEVKRKKSLPSLTPSKKKKKNSIYKPRLNLMPERPGSATLEDLRNIFEFEIAGTQSLLGDTLPAQIRATNLKKRL